MQRVSDENAFAVKADNRRAAPQNRSIPSVGHAHTKIGDAMVRHERRPVRNHVIRGPCVGDDEVIGVGFRRNGVRRRLRQQLGQGRRKTDGR